MTGRAQHRADGRDGGARERGDGRRGGPAPVVPADEREGEQSEGCGDEDRSEELGHAVRGLVAALAERAGSGPDRDRDEREVDEEDPAPAGELDERATEDGPDGRGERRGCTPEADAGGALIVGVEVEQQGERGGDEHRASEAWMTRAMASTCQLGAAAHARLVTAKAASPQSRRRLRP